MREKFIVDKNTLYQIFVAGFNLGSNEGPFPDHGVFEEFTAVIEGKPLPSDKSVRWDIKLKSFSEKEALR